MGAPRPYTMETHQPLYNGKKQRDLCSGFDLEASQANRERLYKTYKMLVDELLLPYRADRVS